MSFAKRTKSELETGALLLITATLGCGCGVSSLVYYSFGTFVLPLQAAFRWSRGEVTSTLFYASFGLVLAAPCIGWLIDRFSVRAVALIAIPLFASALYALSRFGGSLQAFYGLFFLTTALGTGTTPILYTRAITGFFVRQRGLALGITLAGPGVAAIFLPRYMTQIITSESWRHGFVMLSLIALIAFIPVWCWLKSPAHVISAPVNLSGAGRREALTTPVF